MAKVKSAKPIAPAKEQKKLVDVYFDKYAESHQNPKNELIHWICVPLIVFSLLGLVWAIPFPHIGFLGKYNEDFNWASFLIGFSIYYYYKLSPILSYFMLIVVFVFTYGVMELDTWAKTGGPQLWLSCLTVFVLAWVGQFIGHKIEGKKPSFLDDIKFLLIGPIWLLHFVLLRWKVKY
ncbi:Mpo1-like protein [uncultured Mucilaginibacter sp.]|uniref:Mpo1 family 2-hydroxy fatty acid dioxygenase n=1 Tax=uncultured Mucilaginibacter sp. TaxID=797541 RepID=UPI0025F92174|nr:Mpo1-like protein [uncultured Mucilaginibacter sp.]